MRFLRAMVWDFNTKDVSGFLSCRLGVLQLNSMSSISTVLTDLLFSAARLPPLLQTPYVPADCQITYSLFELPTNSNFSVPSQMWWCVTFSKEIWANIFLPQLGVPWQTKLMTSPKSNLVNHWLLGLFLLLLLLHNRNISILIRIFTGAWLSSLESLSQSGVMTHENRILWIQKKPVTSSKHLLLLT